jgi:hypothetical protein
MPKVCVINELSIEDFPRWKGDVLALIGVLEGLWTAIHPLQQGGTLQVWGALKQKLPEETPQSVYFGRMIKAALGTDAKDRDRARRAARLFDRAVTFEDDLGEEALFKPIGGEGRIARGLGQARRTDALAVSLATADAWDRLSIQVRVRTLAPDGGPLKEQEGEVRHAAHPRHVHAHREWMGLSDVERLRVQLAIDAPRHEPASRYTNGKHVQGQTNELRKENARRPRGESQYLAELPNGAPVTDETIKRWEKQALDRVGQDERCVVVPRGDGFWIYCDLREPVGYIGAPEGDDEPTTWVRVEWSADTVHSHPRRPT